jgi:hypothetical protein
MRRLEAEVEGMTIDWRTVFVPTGSVFELVLRATVMYLLILAGFRIFRREAGSLSVSDLLVVVLIADAAFTSRARRLHLPWHA